MLATLVDGTTLALSLACGPRRCTAPAEGHLLNGDGAGAMRDARGGWRILTIVRNAHSETAAVIGAL